MKYVISTRYGTLIIYLFKQFNRMKKIYFFLALMCVVFYSCKKDDSSGSDEERSLSDGFELKVGKSQQESLVEVVRTDGALYVVAVTTNKSKKENDHEGYKGGYRDILVTKINLDGTTGWTKCFGTEQSDFAVAAIAYKGDLIIAGHTCVEFVSIGLGSLVGSSDIMVYRINSSGDVVWQHKEEQDDDQQTFDIALNGDNLYVVRKSGQFGSDVDKLVFNLADNSKTGAEAFEISREFYMQSKVKVSDGYIMLGSISDAAAAIKYDNSLTKQWEKTYKGARALSGVAEYNGSYIFTGTTVTKWYFPFPYYQVCHGDNRAIEMFIMKTDGDGSFSYKSGENNTWKIGIGYLESGWFGEDSQYYMQNDNGRSVVNINGDILIFGNGTQHKEKPGVEGVGKITAVESKAMVVRISPDFKMKDINSDEAFIGWESDFYSKVLRNKILITDMPQLTNVYEVNDVFLLVGVVDGDILLKAYNKSSLM
jgi:hypothetical protein